MLGLGGSMCMEDGIIQSATPTESLFDIPNLIGWWDFTDQATLWTSTTLGGINPGFGVDFRSVANKSSHTDRLGDYLTGNGSGMSGFNAYYQDNPGNLSTDLNYARFIPAVETTAAWDYSAYKRNSFEKGTVSSGVVSNANIDMQNMSVFMVFNPETVDPNPDFNSDRIMFYLNGKDVDGSTTTFSIRHQAGNPHDFEFSFYMADESTPSLRVDTAATGEEATTSKILLSLNTAAGTNATKVYINGVEKGQATYDGDDVLTLDDNYATVMIGNRVSSFGIPGAPRSHFRGNMWEIIFYNQTLTSDQLTFVHNLLMEKHGLT